MEIIIEVMGMELNRIVEELSGLNPGDFSGLTAGLCLTWMPRYFKKTHNMKHFVYFGTQKNAQVHSSKFGEEVTNGRGNGGKRGLAFLSWKR